MNVHPRRRVAIAAGAAVVLALAVVLWAATLHQEGIVHAAAPSPQGPTSTATATTPSPSSQPGPTGTTGATTPLAPGTPSGPPPGGPATQATPAAGPPGAATGLVSASDCQYFPDGTSTPGQALTWAPGAPLGDAQHVDVATDLHGFEAGHFISSKPLQPKDLGFPWRPTKVGQIYTWRVVTTRGTTASPSATQTFTSEACTGGYTGP